MQGIAAMLGKFLMTPRCRVARIVSIQTETQSLALMFMTSKTRGEIWLVRAEELNGFLLYENEQECRKAWTK